jgi:large subunit ribosomal protein L24
MQWNKTVKVRKQRKRLWNAPQHRQHKALTCRLDNRLIEKYKFAISRIPIRKGDKVRIVRGSYKDPNKEIDVVEVRPKDNTIVLSEVTLSKADSKRVPRVFRPAALIITKLNLGDRRRRDRIEALGIILEDEIAAEEEEAKAAAKAKEEEEEEEGEEKPKKVAKKEKDEEATEEKISEEPADDKPKKVVKKKVTKEGEE